MTNFKPDQIPFTAHTFISTRPLFNPITRTVLPFKSVVMFAAFFIYKPFFLGYIGPGSGPGASKNQSSMKIQRGKCGFKNSDSNSTESRFSD